LEDPIMRRLLFSLASLLILGPALWALGDQDKPKPRTPAEQYKALVEEFNKAQKEFMTQYRAATSQEEQKKLFREKSPPPQYAKKFLALAEQHPKDPAAIDALTWVVLHARRSPEAEKAIDILFTEHITSEKLQSVCPALASSSSKNVAEW